MHAYPQARMIGLDWGTSSLRAYLMGPDGAWLDHRQRPWGVRALPSDGFAGALDDILAGWPASPLLAAGMIGSRQGWQETDYQELPAGEDTLVAGLQTVGDPKARGMRIVPGLQDPASGDVMRGEETQVFGALALEPSLTESSRLILPGTHSKWVNIRNGCVTGFSTLMTGELFAVLRDHSILGAGRPAKAPDPAQERAAFDLGVATAKDAGAVGALGRLFSTRTLVLSSRLAPDQAPAYLSGLLIGEEWRIARTAGWLEPQTPLCLVGDTALCARYQLAARHFGLPQPRVIEHATSQGLWRLAGASRMLSVESALPSGGHE